MKNIRPHILWISLALLIFALDRLTKALVLHYLPLHEPVPILPFFNLFFTYNPGAAFSLLHDAGGWQNWLFSAIAVTISGVMMWQLWHIAGQGERWRSAALVLVLGGALGNLYDRVVYHHVIDFLDFYIQGWRHWPAFNIADTAICIGVIILCFTIRKQDR